MKKNIKRRIYDTDTAKQLAFKYVGEFGDTHGYEERLYITKRNLYFIYGTGGPDSPYPQPIIKPLTKEHAEAWEKETSGDKKISAEKNGKPNKSVKSKNTKAKKPPAKKPVKAAEPAKDTETKKDAEIIETKKT